MCMSGLEIQTRNMKRRRITCSILCINYSMLWCNYGIRHECGDSYSNLKVTVMSCLIITLKRVIVIHILLGVLIFYISRTGA